MTVKPKAFKDIPKDRKKKKYFYKKDIARFWFQKFFKSTGAKILPKVYSQYWLILISNTKPFSRIEKKNKAKEKRNVQICFIKKIIGNQ